MLHMVLPRWIGTQEGDLHIRMQNSNNTIVSESHIPCVNYVYLDMKGGDKNYVRCITCKTSMSRHLNKLEPSLHVQEYIIVARIYS